MSNDRAGNGKDNDKDRAVAKTAGFVVFSGIAMSILKALNPLNKPNLQCTHNNTNNGDQTEPVGGDSTQTDHKHQSFSLQEPTIKKPITSVEQNVPGSSQRKVEIVKGGTLWGLSRKYGVSIEAIEEANGLTGDTIYAGKKLIIP
ncbi:hypothetical protein RHGRI_017519 [Rhododendron griersonianum]|uniref:LysM domain-containing protein n=1 Tax=Rhododendron griersonianum TaxID=479676 RepID=A0AAV6JY27_9ERIC|nr:hypothetical protein RHGRI_017519 [Rhododendron griersonianum]